MGYASLHFHNEEILTSGEFPGKWSSIRIHGQDDLDEHTEKFPEPVGNTANFVVG